MLTPERPLSVVEEYPPSTTAPSSSDMSASGQQSTASPLINGSQSTIHPVQVHTLRNSYPSPSVTDQCRSSHARYLLRAYSHHPVLSYHPSASTSPTPPHLRLSPPLRIPLARSNQPLPLN
jgi:hypothetical protein